LTKHQKEHFEKEKVQGGTKLRRKSGEKYSKGGFL
jgi:hypothetical protein